MNNKSKTSKNNPVPADDKDTLPLPTQVVEKAESLPIQWSELADEIKFNIYSFLSPDALLNQQRVSWAEYYFVKDDVLWNQKIRNFPSDTQMVALHKQNTFFALRNETFKNMQKRHVVMLQAIIDVDITTLSQLDLKRSDLEIADKNDKTIKTYLMECNNLRIKNWAYQLLKPQYIDDTPLLEAAIFLGQGKEELDSIMARNKVAERTAVFYCIEYSHLELLKRLVTGRRDLINNDITEPLTTSLLMLASIKGDAEIVQCLLSEGANADVINHRQHTALHLAVMSGHTSCVAALLKHSVSAIYLTDNNRETPAHIAARLGNLECIKLLLDIKTFTAELDTELHYPEQVLFYKNKTDFDKLKQTRLEQYQIRRKAYISLFSSRLFATNSSGETILSIAATKGFTAIVSHFFDAYKVWWNALSLEQTLDPAYNQFQNNKPLLNAINNGHNKIVKLLVKAGMPLGLQGETCPIHQAAINGNLYAVKCLVRHSRKQLNIQDQNQQTPLIHAAAHGQVEVVRYLLRKKADLAIASFGDNVHNRTALHWAAYSVHFNVVELLVLAGAQDTPAMRTGGWSSSILLANFGKLEAIRFIAQNNPAALEDKDRSNQSVLMVAAKKGHLEMVRLLLAQGVQTHHLTNDTRESCLDLALNSGYKAVAVVFEFIRQGVLVNARVDLILRLFTLVKESDLEIAEKGELIKKLCFYVLDNKLSAISVLLRIISMYPDTWLELQDNTGEALLFKLIKCNMSIAFLENYLENVDVNRVDKENKSLIYHAVANENDNAVNFLLKNKANLHTLPSPIHCLLEQPQPNRGTLEDFIKADPKLMTLVDEEGTSVLDKIVTKDNLANNLSYFYQKIPPTEAGDSIKRQALLSALKAKKWDNAGKLMFMGTTIDPQWYHDTSLDIPTPEQLKLLLYIVARRSQGTYKTYLSFFGCKIIGLGYSREEKVDAAEALRDVCLNGAPNIRLDFHKDALNNGELGEICKSLMQFS